MAKITNISGFPEWLPQEKLLENEVIECIKSVYESHGFVPIETPAVELMSTLASKGEIDKEIFSLARAKGQGDEKSGEEQTLGLHFDLTVPFARYVAQHFGNLKFPFRRYQLQKVWRGERPQKGRSREFYQFDIDIVALDELPISCDAEVVSVVVKVFQKLAIGEFKVRLNNRKLLMGVCEAFKVGSELRGQVLVAIDKLEKIGREGVEAELLQLGLKKDFIHRFLEITSLKFPVSNLKSELGALGIPTPEFQSGVEEVLKLVSLVPEKYKAPLVLDLSIARGLDYYTGTILETELLGFEAFGSLCSGGRYENLVSQFINKKIPGVGVSIGLTRLMSLIFEQKLLGAKKNAGVSVLVAVYNEDQRVQAEEFADSLRESGIATEVYFKSPKIGKQIDYADKKGMRYVCFINDDGRVEYKDLTSGEQKLLENHQELIHLV